jgi:hypothetical protein
LCWLSEDAVISPATKLVGFPATNPSSSDLRAALDWKIVEKAGKGGIGRRWSPSVDEPNVVGGEGTRNIGSVIFFTTASHPKTLTVFTHSQFSRFPPMETKQMDARELYPNSNFVT